MPQSRNNTTTVRLYNLAKKKQQQRIKSNDPGARKGSNVSPRKLMQQIGVETKKRAKMNKKSETKFITRKGRRISVPK